MNSEGRKCVWCGSPANSKEHVYPQWLQNFDGPSDYIAKNGHYQDARPQLIVRTDPDGRLVEYPAVRAKKEPILHQVKVRAVCQECNSGWMSRLETKTKPIVRRLTQGPGSAPSSEEMETLSSWTHKTFLMYDLWETPLNRRYQSEDYENFYNIRRPPEDTRIYIGASHSPGASFAMWSDSNWLIPGGTDADSYVSSHGKNIGSSYLAVDGLVIIEHWFSSDYPSSDPDGKSVLISSHRKMRRLGTQEIHPKPRSFGRWPRRVLGLRRTEAARLALLDAMRSLPVHANMVHPPK